MDNEKCLVDVGVELSRCANSLTANEEKMIFQVIHKLQKISNYFEGKESWEVEAYNGEIINGIEEHKGYGLDFIFKKYGLGYQEFNICRGWVKFDINDLFDLDNFKREKNKFLEAIKKMNNSVPMYKNTKDKVYGTVRIIDDIGFSIKDNIMFVKFNHELEPLYRVFGKMGRFNRIAVKDMSKLKSHSSIRMYVLVCEMKHTGLVKISEKSLCDIFNISTEQANYRKILVKYIKKSIEEIYTKIGLAIVPTWQDKTLILKFKRFSYEIPLKEEMKIENDR